MFEVLLKRSKSRDRFQKLFRALFRALTKKNRPFLPHPNELLNGTSMLNRRGGRFLLIGVGLVLPPPAMRLLVVRALGLTLTRTSTRMSTPGVENTLSTCPPTVTGNMIALGERRGLGTGVPPPEISTHAAGRPVADGAPRPRTIGGGATGVGPGCAPAHASQGTAHPPLEVTPPPRAAIPHLAPWCQ